MDSLPPPEAALAFVVAGLAQLVYVAGRLDPVAKGRIGVVSQPVGCFHDVRVGVMDESTLDIGHVENLAFHAIPKTG